MTIKNISLCTIEEKDNNFLVKLFKECHPEFVSIHNISNEQKEDIIYMQFTIEQQQVLQKYPNAKLNIIMKDNEPIGKFYINYGVKAYHIIEIGLLKNYRGIGIGKKIIDEVIKKAVVNDKEVSLQVNWFNESAITFYHKLGFKLAEDKGAFYEMNYRL